MSILDIFYSLMQKDRKIFRIPRDPRTDDICFISEIPLDLVDSIEQSEWEGYVSEINQVFIDKEKPSFWNFIKLLLVIPAFYKVQTYEKAVEKTLEIINSKMKDRGLRIENPVVNGYTELVVVFVRNPKKI